jgi:hypothetical protein
MSSLQHSNQDPFFAADSEDYDDDDRLCNRVPVGLVRIDPTEEFDVLGTTFQCFNDASKAAQAFAQAALLHQTKRQKNTYFYCFRSGTSRATVHLKLNIVITPKLSTQKKCFDGIFVRTVLRIGGSIPMICSDQLQICIDLLRAIPGDFKLELTNIMRLV